MLGDLQRTKRQLSPQKDIDAGGSLLGENILPRRHWCWQVPFWSVSSSLLKGLNCHQSVQVLDTLINSQLIRTQSHLPPGGLKLGVPDSPASRFVTWHCPPIGKDRPRHPWYHSLWSWKDSMCQLTAAPSPSPRASSCPGPGPIPPAGQNQDPPDMTAAAQDLAMPTKYQDQIRSGAP